MKIMTRAPAKLNLSLDTPRIHSDGTIEWRMIMISIGLSDYVQVETTMTNLIEIFSDSGFLPQDNRNLAYKAAQIFLEETQIKTGLKITIEKNIPVAAGLGGGSSDAAAVFRALNELFQVNLPLVALAKMGLRVDSDVPYCIYGDTALVSGRGDVITPLPKLPKMWFVLAKPHASVSTPRILKKLSTTAVQHPRTEALLAAITNRNYQEIISNMGNALETITIAEHPQILTLKERLIKYGCDTSQMSGSGPTVFGVCRTESRAKRVYNSLSGFCHEVYLTQVTSEKPRIN